MRVAIGCDHRGVTIKSQLRLTLEQAGHAVTDVGTDSPQSVDYPDFAEQVGKLIGCGNVDRGILICGSGIGMCIAANKLNGVRAANCQDEWTAEMGRRHNDVNVLCLSADMLGDQMIDRIVNIWLSTEFEGGRHARRVEKIRHLEE